MSSNKISNQKQLGISLLELLLVFLIASALIFVGINHYKRLDRQKNIEAVKYNVDLLKLATITYYRKHIKDPFDPNDFNLQKLIEDKLWPPTNLQKTNIVKDYAAGSQKITQEQTPPTYNFTATVILKSTEAANLMWLKNFLNATSADAGGNSITWLYLPTYSIPTMDTGLWILNTDLQQFKKATTENN